MTEAFKLPPGMYGRFAVVKLWPEIKTAEDECIARLKIAATTLGLECIEVHADGRLLSDPGSRVSHANVDFVLHLHYDTPKLYDAFSFVALWNPLRFYHEWGYRRTSRNLTSHDDFISCASMAADDHVSRMVRGAATHLPPLFRLFHSTADIVHPPSLGDGKLFYAGINWEALGGGKSRHQEVLERLDGTGLLRIYGPTLFQGVRVWDGYQSYVREVPFDGVSMIDEISRAGIALVLSSQAHKESELMSNRLFESIAAGALVICDENPFAARHFGDALLYIDGRSDAEEIERDIRRHLQWAQDHPEAALEKAARAQSIFRESFTLVGNLRELYMGLPGRRLALAEQQYPPSETPLRVQVDFLMADYSPAVLDAHIESALSQTYPGVVARLVVDTELPAADLECIKAALRSAGNPLALRQVRFQNENPVSGIRSRRRLGEVVIELIPEPDTADAFVLVAPNEQLWSNHVAVLAGALARKPEAACAATGAVLQLGSAAVHAVHDILDFRTPAARDHTGLGRFIFRTSAVPVDIGIALRHADGLVAACLLGSSDVAQELPATIAIALDQVQSFSAISHEAELEAVHDYAPGALEPRYGAGLRTPFLPRAPEGPLPPLTVLQLARKALDFRWLQLQYRALRRYGPASRLLALRRRLGLA